MSALIRLTGWLLGPGPKSLKGYLDLGELVKVLIAAAIAGATAPEVLAQVIGQLPAIVGPENVALAAAILTALLEGWRRLGQGSSPRYPRL